MELQTIGEISKMFGISAQMLRYYERIGLVQSSRREDYAYRVYDEEAIKRLQKIIILRKLQISVKQIKEIFNNENSTKIIEVFEQKISELDIEVTSLSTIKTILSRLAEELRASSDLLAQLDLLGSTNMLSIVDSISFSKNHINNEKENVSMDDLIKASDTLEKIEKQKPMIFVYQVKKEEFYFIGKEYPRSWLGIIDAWDDFDKSGGWDMVTKYRNKPFYNCTVVNHLINPNGNYMAGTFVDEMDIADVPDGFTLRKFPACEFLIVTHEWQPGWDLWIVEEAVKKVQIPDGYVKYEDGENVIRLIEVEHNHPEKGSRWENWIPIKKI